MESASCRDLNGKTTGASPNSASNSSSSGSSSSSSGGSSSSSSSGTQQQQQQQQQHPAAARAGAKIAEMATIPTDEWTLNGFEGVTTIRHHGHKPNSASSSSSDTQQPNDRGRFERRCHAHQRF
jgi:hypothetical protein